MKYAIRGDREYVGPAQEPYHPGSLGNAGYYVGLERAVLFNSIPDLLGFVSDQGSRGFSFGGHEIVPVEHKRVAGDAL